MESTKQNWLERPIHPSLPAVTLEVLLFGLIMLIAALTRFYILETRAMSHDESLHTYFSWLLYKGQGYQHSPMMHGPFQFHFVALIYFIFGATDFTARIPAVLFSLATIWMLWYWRRYLGKAGALIAALLLVISPIMLFYGRYVRNESFVGLFGILMLYSMLRYQETGRVRYLYLLTTSVVLHFCTKETAFIYAAQALLYLGVFFVIQITRRPWKTSDHSTGFILALAVAILLAAGAMITAKLTDSPQLPAAATTVQPLDPNVQPSSSPETHPLQLLTTVLGVMAGIALVAALVFMITGYTWDGLRRERSFDMLILLGTLILPQLTAFPVKYIGEFLHKNWDPIDYTLHTPLFEGGMAPTAVILVLMLAISVVIGLLWKPNLWIKNALVFYGIFTVLYTTVFTNGPGFFSGIVGSLGYWLVQQGVERGSQPWYYYTLVEIPMYEFLPALGVLLALAISLKRLSRRSSAPQAEDSLSLLETEPETDGAEASTPMLPPDDIPLQSPAEPEAEKPARPYTLALLGWWSLSSLLAYTIAGEKMPWLTYHIALPFILVTGWALGQVLEKIDWQKLRQQKPLIVVLLTGLFFAGVSACLDSLLGGLPPFQGKELVQLQATATFSLALLGTLGSLAGLYYLLQKWNAGNILRVGILTLFTLLAALTARASFRASYVLYDTALEYLVYAHAGTGVKQVMSQLEEISLRTTGDKSMLVAYDASAPDTGVSWPFVWYLRDYPNQRSFDTPTRSLRDAQVIVVDQKNFDKIKPVVGEDYYQFNYMRMWWPNQDYFYLTSERSPEAPFPEDYPCTGVWSILKLNKSVDYSRVCNAFTNREILGGIYDIWLNRDYERYAQATGSKSMTLTTWVPADEMRLYIRKDLAAQIWNFGVSHVEEVKPDLYQENSVLLSADLVFGSTGTEAGQFNAPRGIAFASDGSFYVADSRNHRIQHFDAEGKFLGMWGSFGDSSAAPAAPGTFNEPWGVAAAPDGSVYVTDTWNHRVQKFTAEGRPVLAWGHYGLGETGEAFWGPRGIAVDSQGRVYVADTGNKRIAIFTGDGKFLTQFGTVGLEPGQFDEPVGLAVDSQGYVYVADTWNQRIQVFAGSPDGIIYLPMLQWDVNGWYGQSLENKPFLAVDQNGSVFAADPEGYRVLQFTSQGQLVRAWGDFGTGNQNFGLAAAVAMDGTGRAWVTDAGNNRILRFSLPAVPAEAAPAPQQPESLPLVNVPVAPIPSSEVVPQPESCKVYTGYVDGWLNVRSCAGTSCPVIAVLPEGSVLSLQPTEQADSWIAVQFGETTGWVYAGYCKK